MSTQPHFLGAVLFSIVLFYLPASYGQISEEVVPPTTEESVDSSSESNTSRCFPPCRKGFFCSDGQCVSKCNPPCPEGLDCWDDAECRPSSAAIRKALNETDRISEVFAEEELVQGAVIRTNVRNAGVRILDTTFECKGELFLNVPNGKYEIFVDAPNYFVNEEDLEVRLGTVDTIEVKLRPYQINPGLALGISSMKGFSLLAGEAHVGIGLYSLAYIGITGTYVGPIDSDTIRLTSRENEDVPDTLRAVWTELIGMGLACGYLGINPIARRIKLIPQIAFGYWKYDDQTYFMNRFRNGKTENLDDLEQHDIEKYFVRPTLDVRIGERLFNFDGRLSVFLGTGPPIVTLLAGFQIAVPR